GSKCAACSDEPDDCASRCGRGSSERDSRGSRGSLREPSPPPDSPPCDRDPKSLPPPELCDSRGASPLLEPASVLEPPSDSRCDSPRPPPLKLLPPSDECDSRGVSLRRDPYSPPSCARDSLLPVRSLGSRRTRSLAPSLCEPPCGLPCEACSWLCPKPFV